MKELAPSNLSRRQLLKALTVCSVSTGVLGSRVADAGTADKQQAEKQPADKQQKAKQPKVSDRREPWLTLPPTPKLPTPTRSGYVSANGVKNYFAQFGEGPPLLLLHGGLANSNYWGNQLPELEKHFSVTVMDTRGHGRSPLSSGSFSFSLFAQDVIALLDFLEIEQASIVGWSDGAITGLKLAMTSPERVNRLLAFGANSSLAGLKPGGSKSSVFASYSSRCKTEYTTLSPHPERWPYLLHGLRPMWRKEPNFTSKDLAAVKAPTLISAGEHDEIIKREDSERMARAIPGARLAIQRRVSHFAMLQNPAQFTEVMIKFLTDGQ